ncbi:transcription factor Opi1-domain-containing protein [Radiomyces spectabilis]|uniref:transcription factor Opi1-domain-containing protein n=1 Tax=Radiomyces spectabilis TaxID=64574 RepID=UPI0022209B2B|nr:transcription factor Opi1-domain-containing protein [Radiomyces spectabilis]KAI8376011.1 transcription factor Opi1-domain-containing protein [Radiomyces spectabilis]
MTQPSAMSITQLCSSPAADGKDQPSTFIHEDPDVQMAAEALGDMAKSGGVPTAKPKSIQLPPLSTNPSAPSTTPSSPLPTPSSSASNPRYSFSSDSTQEDVDPLRPSSTHMSHAHSQQYHFMHRVSNIPLVNSALRAYESSKASNSMVKYGAEMVESFAAPIYDKFSRRALSNDVDDWGCKQLDKLEEKYPKYVSGREKEEDEANIAAHALARTSISDNHDRDRLRKRRIEDREDTSLKARSRPCSRSTSPHRPYTITKPTATRHHPSSRWHRIVMHAGSAAGTTAAVVSEESMKCLRYCLTWLEYATQHIDQQMNILRSFLVSLATQSSSSSSSEETAVAKETSAASTLASIKKEIIDTLRKVVDVVSKYAGSGLPEHAKASVRGFILALPGRWATLNSSTTASPMNSPRVHPQDPRTHETSIKLLNFGGESIEMLQAVSSVFSDTIERAELWLQRLRVVGVTGTPRTEADPVPMETINEQSSSSKEPEPMDVK